MKNSIVLAVVLLGLVVMNNGCSALTGPSDTKTFKLGGSRGYRGESVGNCDQRSADKECRKLGYDKATSWDCSSVHVSGGFFGSFDQDVMYSVTCVR